MLVKRYLFLGSLMEKQRMKPMTGIAKTVLICLALAVAQILSSCRAGSLCGDDRPNLTCVKRGNEWEQSHLEMLRSYSLYCLGRAEFMKLMASYPSQDEWQVGYEYSISVEKQIVGKIKAAKSKEQLAFLCNSTEGAFINFGQNDWIAIASFCHHCFGYNLTIYYDSKGNLLRSHLHYCEGFYRHNDTQIEQSAQHDRDFYDRYGLEMVWSGAVFKGSSRLDINIWSAAAISYSLDEVVSFLLKSNKYARIQE
jgi:hypothetical protein